MAKSIPRRIVGDQVSQKWKVNPMLAEKPCPKFVVGLPCNPLTYHLGQIAMEFVLLLKVDCTLWKESFEFQAAAGRRRRGMKNMAISSPPHVLRPPFIRSFLALMAPISLGMIYTRTLFGMRRRHRAAKASWASVVPPTKDVQ